MITLIPSAIVALLATSPSASAENCQPHWDNAIGQPGLGGISIPAVWAMTVLPNGDLVVGGDFTTAGDVPANRIARWDSTSGEWHALGSGMNNDVRALAVLPNGDIVAAGQFSVAGGVTATGVARWDGKSWHSLGSGLNAFTYSLAVLNNGDLVAGGAFLVAGGVSAVRIARWDGESWHPMGSGMNATVEALKVLPNGDLIAGGIFTIAGGVSALRIARWDGESWHPLGSGLNARVSALAFLPDPEGGDLFVSGQFTALGGAGGAPVNRIARWDGTSWYALGSGMNDWVRALAVVPNEGADGGADVFAGGVFTTAGGASALRVARWDGASSAAGPAGGSWHPLGSGTDSSAVVAMATLPKGETGGDVVVGGWFSSAGGSSASSIAKWITCSETEPGIPGDLNGDGMVNVDDLLMLLAAWGDCQKDCIADIAPPNVGGPDGDGIVNVDDLLVLLANWG